ncbi:hypothetical protein AAFA46_08065 [Oscillospiraceae bacterium WX1]
MPRVTYAEIKHRLIDETAKPEAIYNMSDKLPVSSYNQIKNDTYIVDTDSRAMLENNYWVLDGSLQLVPEDPSEITWGLWSNSLSDDNGDFTINPELNVTFENVHTSSGIKFTFSGDTFPKQIVITWYHNETALTEKTYFVVSAMSCFADLTVENYNALSVEFIGTATPNRRVKIVEIDYGETKVWGKGSLISANVLEEINLASNEVSINTIDFTIHDADAEFNMLNPSGVYSALQQKQALTVTEYVNGEAFPMGKFYLDTWKNSSSVVASFTAFDAIGLFDTITYKTSALWSGTAASAVFADIFAAAGWTDYTIEDEIATELVYGYIPVVTVREALHQLCFALHAACIPNRNGVVEIKRLPSDADAVTIEKSQKSGSQSITQNALINSVAVTAYSFETGSSKQLYNESLAVGTYVITFESPATGISASGATINANGVNYASINVNTAGTVTINGYEITANASVHIYEAPDLTDISRAQATVDSIYLISSYNAAALAQYLYEDYQRRIVQSFTLALEDETAGDNVDVDTMLGARKTGVITKLDIDLTGGFLADCEVRG